MMSPSISIIIPVKPGGAVRALDGLRAIQFPSGSLQVLVAEGRQPSRQRNVAAAAATGTILYFLDDDSVVQHDALNRLIRHFDDPRVAVAGGPSLTPATDSLWQRAFGAALSSRFGGGGVRNRYRRTGHVRSTHDNELILCNLGFRRDLFLQFGGLDERLYPNEENELMDRVLREGFRCIHDPELAVFRSQRPNYRAFVRQMVTYGRGRAEQTLISRRVHLPVFIPGLFLLYLLLLPALDNHVYSVPLLCYALLAFLFAAADGARVRDIKVSLLLPLIFPTLHLGYGAGIIWGLLRPRIRTRSALAEEVTIRDETATITMANGAEA